MYAIRSYYVTLGAGRATKDSLIDYSAGIILKKKIGDKVETGECIAELYSSIISDFNEAISMLDNVFEITSELLGQRESRITSYNVCYTKLLRSISA